MKRLNWFFVAITAMLMLSCQKPEGDMPGSYSGGEHRFSCQIDRSTALKVSFNSDTSLFLSDEVRMLGMSLLYLEDGDTITGIKEKKIITEETILNPRVWRYNDTLWDLKPGTKYWYWLVMEDYFSVDTLPVDTVRTIYPRFPKVIADSANVVFSDHLLHLYATVSMPWRAKLGPNGLDKSGFTFKWGEKKDELDHVLEDVNVLSWNITNDSVRIVIETNLNFNTDTVWYQATATNSWGSPAVEESQKECFTGQHKVFTDPMSEGLYDLEWAELRGSSRKGVAEQDSIYEWGFYVSTNEEQLILPTNRYLADHRPEWNKRFSYTIMNLTPGTKYYYKAFIKVNNSNGNEFYGEEIRSFTTKALVTVKIENPIQVGPNNFLITGSFVGVDESQVEKMGFCWKKKVGNEQTVNSSNCDGEVIGQTSPQFPSQFGADISGLEPNTTYLVCSYVILKDDHRTLYSETIQVTTTQP